MELAVKDYEKAIKLKDDFDFLYGDLMFSKMSICDWLIIVQLLLVY